MERGSRLRRVCPQCDATLHAKRAVCACGHAFLSKRKAQSPVKKEAMKRRRSLESEQESIGKSRTECVKRA